MMFVVEKSFSGIILNSKKGLVLGKGGRKQKSFFLSEIFGLNIVSMIGMGQ